MTQTQYPDEKEPHSNWVYPAQDTVHTSRDGVPAPGPAPSAYTAPPGNQQQQQQRQQYAAVPQVYYPPQGPPPDYGHAQSHPDGRSGYDHKEETVLAPSQEHYDTPGQGDAGPSSSSGPEEEGKGGIMMSIASFFGNKGPPPMWQRQAPTQLPYNAFPPMCLISNSKDLTKGFPELPPPCRMNPHPFATHDVMEEDWKRFLADIKKAGSLSPAQRIKSNVIPMVTGLSLVTGFLATIAIEKRMKYKNRGAAGDLVDHWNHYFFGPRRMEVVLVQGTERLSGQLGIAPVGDPEQTRMANRLRQHGSDDDMSSDSFEDDHHWHHRRRGGLGVRRERREVRRGRRAERRARKVRGEYEEPYELLITATV